MLELETLIAKAPPPLYSERTPAATTELDQVIMGVLEEIDSPCRPSHLAELANASPRRVSARLGVLVKRGLILRTAEPGGPQRGPGAFLYSKA